MFRTGLVTLFFAAYAAANGYEADPYAVQYDPYAAQYGDIPQEAQQGYANEAYTQQAAGDYHQPVETYEPEYPVPAATLPKTEKPVIPNPGNFNVPGEAYPTYHPEEACDETCQPNSAKYMAYKCTALYAAAVQWGKENCAPHINYAHSGDVNSQVQAALCTYWTQKSIYNVVTGCFIESHLRNEFVMRYGRDGPGVWFCKYKEFVNQVLDCYKSSLKYYPLGDSMNHLEESVAGLYVQDEYEMPPLQFTGASVAMCAYYNKDQVHNRADYQ